MTQANQPIQLSTQNKKFRTQSSRVIVLTLALTLLVGGAVFVFASYAYARNNQNNAPVASAPVSTTQTTIDQPTTTATPTATTASTASATTSAAPAAQTATVVSDVNLNVPMHYQQHPLSCEAAALTMALQYKGVSITENQIISAIGFDSTPHTSTTWGDPQQAFVGNIDGQQSTTGYGVYWQPIARVGGQYRPTQAFTGWTIQQLTQSIVNGNPVVVWYNAGSGRRIDWQTPTGQTVRAIDGEHAVTVRGFTGPQDNPTGIIYNDPIHGTVTASVATFSSQWSLLGNSGVVVQ